MPSDTRLVDSTVEDKRKKKRVLEYCTMYATSVTYYGNFRHGKATEHRRVNLFDVRSTVL